MSPEKDCPKQGNVVYRNNKLPTNSEHIITEYCSTWGDCRIFCWRVVLVFESRQGLGIFLFSATSRPALGPTQHPIQWIPGAFLCR